MIPSLAPHTAFRVFHPSDFSEASEVAFAHALKIALQARAELDVMHVEPHITPERAYWTEYPAVRHTLARWGILPEGVAPEEIAKTGLRVTKVLTSSPDTVESMLRHFERFPPDIIVLATHQRAGLERWFHKAVAEPLARKSGSMTLFVPYESEGFVNLANGAVKLERILVPVDHVPDPQPAVSKASLLLQGLGCTSAELRLIHVSSGDTMPLVDLPQTGWSYSSIVTHGNVVDEIVKAEKEWKADLLVLMTQGHVDFLDALRGSTTERVLRGASCPVLAIPASA